MKALSYEDQKELMALSLAVLQSGMRSAKRTSDGSRFETVSYSPTAVNNLKKFCFSKVSLDEARELYFDLVSRDKQEIRHD